MSRVEWTEAEFEARMRAIEADGVIRRGPSRAERMLTQDRVAFERFVAQLSPIDRVRLQYDWRFWARPKQLAPSEYEIWLVMSGRGFGKNKTAAETVRDEFEGGRARQILFVAPDWKDARRNMVGGRRGWGGSGFLDVIPPWVEARWLEGKAEIHLRHPAGHTGVIYVSTAEQPEQRGGNFDLVWLDEPIKYKYLEKIVYNVEMALREADHDPRMIITTTPKPIDQLKAWIMDPGTVVTHGHTTENRSNLSGKAVRKLLRKYGGTRLGMQELEAKILGDNDAALFHMSIIEAHRVKEAPKRLVELCVAVDPAVSKNRKSDKVGIVVAGRADNGHIYVLADATDFYTPAEWSGLACQLAKDWGAHYLVVERNKIGDLGAHTLKMAMKEREMKELPIREAYSMASKEDRAAPVAALYELGRVHHVGRGRGRSVLDLDMPLEKEDYQDLHDLETEITSWDPTKTKSPNRLDALVHGCFVLARIGEEEEAEVDEDWKGFEEANAGFEMSDGVL